MKARRRKTTKQNRRSATTAARRRGSSTGSLNKKVALLTRELAEALEQQTATSEVLKVISSSPGELEPVFQTMLANAMKICKAKSGFIYRFDGDVWQIMARYGAVPAFYDFAQQSVRPGPETVIGRIAKTRNVVEIADLSATRGYAERDPLVVTAVEVGGVRTFLGVPMFKENELVGAVLLYRQEVRPFTRKADRTADVQPAHSGLRSPDQISGKPKILRRPSRRSGAARTRYMSVTLRSLPTTRFESAPWRSQRECRRYTRVGSTSQQEV